MATRKAIVTTKYRGVFYGDVVARDGHTVDMDNCIMVIYWGTEKGLFQLAEYGPSTGSRLSSVCPSCTLLDITGVFDVTPEAAKVFSKAIAANEL